MSRKWQLQEAKNRLSEVVDLALTEGPQTVTRRGKDVVIIVSKADFEKGRSGKRRGTFVEFMRSLAFVGADLDIRRARDPMRNVDL